MPKDIRALLHEQTLRYQSLPENAEIAWRAPIELLTPNRLDIPARYLFAKNYLAKRCVDLGQDVYTGLIRAWHERTKGFDPGKRSLDDYVHQFRALIDNLGNSGFDEEQSVIPLVDGSIVDGAHRVAAALALGIEKMPCVTLQGVPQVQNAQTLRSIGISPQIVDYCIQQHVELDPRLRAAVFFPCAQTKLEEGLALFSSRNEVVYTASVHVTRRGMENFVTELYGNLDWWDEYQEKSFAARRYKKGVPVTVVFFRQNLDDMQEFKDQVRDVLQQANDSIHTTDAHWEAVNLARLVYNANSLDCLNYAKKGHTPVFDARFARYKELVQQNPAHEHLFALDYGSVLAAYGLRDVSDIDYVFDQGAPDIEDMEMMINPHNWLYVEAPLRLDLLIHDPRNHFYKNGVKFLCADIVQFVKSRRTRSKDNRDVFLLKNRHSPLFLSAPDIRGTLRRLKSGGARAAHSLVLLCKKHLPETMYQKLRGVYRTFWKREE
ncbi:MAG: hypothetical protein LBD42_09385 [Desulfovibrio sp.]|nr:hypothetical protein [Desulfovibrio sp.]